MAECDLMANAIIYDYPGGERDIICASDKTFVGPGWEAAEDYSKRGRGGAAAPAPREAGAKSGGDDMLRSMRRARSQLRRLALANEFTWFVTLTFDKQRIDRYDGEAIAKVLRRWLSNMVQRHGLRYILVPERHQDGAYHFHGFFAGEGLETVDSGTIKRPGHKKPQRPRSEAQRAEWLAAGGEVVYNLPQWNLGFTTALQLYGTYSAAVGYVCKYVGKQDGERPLGRWYYSGGQLAKPAKTYAALDYRALAAENAANAVEFEIPGSKLLVIHTRQGE